VRQEVALDADARVDDVHPQHHPGPLLGRQHLGLLLRVGRIARHAAAAAVVLVVLAQLLVVLLLVVRARRFGVILLGAVLVVRLNVIGRPNANRPTRRRELDRVLLKTNIFLKNKQSTKNNQFK
jgi:hypothetical protein